MAWDPMLTGLRSVLVELYPAEEDARQVVLTAGLDPQQIAFSSKAINNWTNILTVAANNEQVEDLVRAASDQFARNKRLQVAVETYRAGKPAVPQAPPPIFKPAAVDKRALRNAMVGAFSTEDLEILCADIQAKLAEQGIDLQVNLAMVGGGSKPIQVLNLIEYLDRRRYLEYLVEAVREARPGII